jgi:hypothetical protein
MLALIAAMGSTQQVLYDIICSIILYHMQRLHINALKIFGRDNKLWLLNNNLVNTFPEELTRLVNSSGK